jgi:outer membrane receptor protein involved in Fe transport
MTTNFHSRVSAWAGTAVLALTTVAQPALAQDVPDDEMIEEIVVIAERLGGSVQDVPTAITAIGADQMQRQQIENTSDMQLTVPNVSYSKGNFTTSAFQIRGIGNTAVGSTADSGVSVHMNDIPLESHRLYAVEFYDVETISILRGPQGTLFGRNATGGLINVTTKKPTDQFEGSFEVEVGDYSSQRLQGMINIPMGDMFSARIAGIMTERDGYTENLATGNDIDGRDMYSVRGTLRFEPSDRTTIDLMVNYMEDDSSRSRYQKKLCNRDPVGNLGCLGDTLEFELPNGLATLPSNLASNLVLGDPTADPITDPITNWGLSLFPFGYDIMGGTANPADMRTVNLDFEPTYYAEDTFISLTLDQAIGDYHDLTVSAAFLDTSFRSRTDFDGTIGAPITDVGLPGFGLSPALGLFAPTTLATVYGNGDLPYSNISTSNLGIIGLDTLGAATNYYAYDQSNTDGEQTTFEAILKSDFDGNFNYLLGGIYFDYEGSTDYNLAANTIDYFSLMALPGQVGNLADGTGIASPFFVNETDLYGLETYAIFGEVYYNLSDRMKLTVGLRYTNDEKRVSDRNLLLNSLLAGNPMPTPLGSPVALGLPEYREDSETFDDTTGRVVLDWAMGDSTMAYVSYSRGYKGGGFNPPFDPAVFPNASRTFDPETINAYEIGTKSLFADGDLTLNLAAFYYDYKGLQVSRIVNRTSFNENVDSEITGLEAEFIWSPTDNLVINGMVSFLDTEIGDVAIADARDPAAGIADATVVKDILSSENCVILWNGSPDPATTLPQVDPAFGLLPFSDCQTLSNSLPGINGVLQTNYEYTDAVEKNVTGNPLAGSPETSFSLGAQYTFRIGNLDLTPRVDYYWQDDSQARIFNSPVDTIESWDNINAQITLTPDSERWFARVFVQNLNDDDNITGMYLDPAAVGLSTNVFLMEPRRYGASFGMNFD